MAPSPGTYVLEGVKLSVDMLEKISSDLPPPTSAVLGLVQQVIAIVETIQENQEQCQLLIDRLLRLLLVVLAALKQQSTGTPGHREFPLDLKWKIDRFKDNLDGILKDVTKIQSIVNSHRKRDKLRAALLAGSYKADIKKCSDQLDWAMTEFNVSSRLTDAIRLCTVSRQVHQVLTNQHLDKLPIAKYARFDCERPDHPSSCFQGTREAIIKEIIAWITDPNPQAERFFWLNGLAGIGKTTIARTVAELAQSFGLLGATFFFSRRGEAELRNPALVIPTIAHQLALFDPTFCEPITAAIQAHPDAPFSSLKQQLDRLIIEPLSELERDPERVVIILFDAFDECESVGATNILQLLVAAIPSLPFFLKIFVTSRPEPHIRIVLVPSTDQLRITALHDIEASIVKSDILVYLRANIRDLPKKKGLNLRADWVTDEEIQLLANAAGNLFIYAATALRFLMRALNLRPQLNLLLKIVTSLHGSSDGSKPFFSLDQLYTEILHGLVTPENQVEVLALLQVVLGSIVLLRDPLPVDALECLTGLQEDDAVATLSSLHSLILPPSPPDNCPRTYHPSFPDFLQDPSRCTDPDLFIETQKHETQMAIHCLELLNAKLHKGMLKDLDTTLLNSEVEDLEEKVNAAFPPELKYACRFWHSHLAKVPSSESEKVLAFLDVFVSLRLLPWLESMSWMGRTREAIQCLELANSWVTKSSATAVTTSLLNDGYRLLLAHFPTIAESASHIAQSVLPFAPRNTQLMNTYAEYTHSIIKVVYPVESEWPPCLMSWRSHSGMVTSIAISPDGSRIASGSGDRNINIHDASSGGFIMALTGHSHWVRSVAFSPDGSWLVSGSLDHTIRLWDAIIGRELLKLEGHTGVVYSVVFSPDGDRIASGSGDMAIRVWDVTGNVLMQLVGHSGAVNTVKFFPDERRLVSGSNDKTVRIWDLTSGTCTTVLEGHLLGVRSVTVSPDGSRIASGSFDYNIQIWDATNGTSLATLRGHEGIVCSTAFSPGGSLIVSGSSDRLIRSWNETTCDTVSTFRGHTHTVSSVVFSPDGRRVVSGGMDGTVKIWDATSLVETTSQERSSHWGTVSSLAFSSDGTRLASFEKGVYNNVQVRELVEGHSVVSSSAHTPTLGWGVHFSPDDTRIIVAYPGRVPMIFDASSGNQIKVDEPPILDVPQPSQTTFKVQDGKLLRNDLPPSVTVCILPPSYDVGASAISSCKIDGILGDRVAIGFYDGQILVLDVTP